MVGNLDVDILTVGNLDVDISTVGNLDVDILTVGNLDVDISTVGNLDVDISTVGNLDVDKRTNRLKCTTAHNELLKRVIRFFCFQGFWVTRLGEFSPFGWYLGNF
jgi:hypothetical protein